MRLIPAFGRHLDYQASYFNRTTSPFHTRSGRRLLFNGVASESIATARSTASRPTPPIAGRLPHASLHFRQSRNAHWSPTHPGIAGRFLTGNQTDPVTGAPFGPPFTVFDSSAKTGWLFGTYLQDEWKITNQLTLNAGLRFDQMYQYVGANQLSPRLSLT